MATYTTTKVTLDEIAARSEENRKRLERAKALIATALADLTAMGQAYSAFGTQLDIDAAASPTDTAWQAAKAEKDQMIVDFQATKTEAETLNTAVGN